MNYKEISGFDQTVRSKVRCGKCGGSMAKGVITLVQLQLLATWKYPVAGHICFDLDHAVAILCDDCIAGQLTSRHKIREAVEINGDLVTYHPVEELSELPFD